METSPLLLQAFDPFALPAAINQARAKVLPVGGIKEKALAAHPVGIREVILPRRNQRDIEDIPEELRKELRLMLVDDAEEVLRHALTPASANIPGAAR